MTVHQLVDKHLNPTPRASPNANPSIKSGAMSQDVSRLIGSEEGSKCALTDTTSVGVSKPEPPSFGSPNNLI